nr:hypothetical protein [Tanacetum cinerariifolium]
AQQFANTHDPLALMANTQTPIHLDQSSLITYIRHPQPNNNFVLQPLFNTNYMQQLTQNLEDISDPTTAIDMTLELMAKAFTLNNTTLTNNNQRSSSNPSNMQIAQPSMNMDQDRQMLMVEDNVGNQFRPNAVQNNGNVVPAPAEGNVNVINGNPIRCYNCRGEGHYANNCTVKPRKRDAAYIQTQLQIAQKDKAGIQLNSKEFDFMAAPGAYDVIKKVTANYNLHDNLQQTSTSGTQSDKAPVYDTDGSAENDSNVIFAVSSVKQSGGIVKQHPANVEETQAAKFVRDFKSLAKEADESLVKHKAFELEIERILRVVFSRNIMSVVQNNSVEDTSNLQTELEPYNDMQQKIERLQAQLGDLKGKSKDTSCVSDTLNPLPQKLENENVELEFQVQNYEKENAHLKTVYKNLFDSINVTWTQTKTIINSLQTKLHDTIYENAKLRAQLFDKVSKQKDTTRETSVNTKFAKQSILGKLPSSSRPKLYDVTPLPKSTAFPKVGETNALSNSVTSNTVPSSQEPNVVTNDNVISPETFRMNPFKAFRVDNFVSNKHVKASVRTKPITVS